MRTRAEAAARRIEPVRLTAVSQLPRLDLIRLPLTPAALPSGTAGPARRDRERRMRRPARGAA